MDARKMINASMLRRAKYANVIRLAKSLELRIEGMSQAHVIRLVYWRITRPSYRDALAYEAVWDGLLSQESA